MKKPLAVLFALLLVVGLPIVGAPHTRTNIPLVKDVPHSGDHDDRARSSLPTIPPTAYVMGDEVHFLHILISDASSMVSVVITGRDNACYLVLNYPAREQAGADELVVNLEENGIPRGEYTLQIFYVDSWWIGDFATSITKTGVATIRVDIDDICYLLEGGQASVVAPGVVRDTVFPYSYPSAIDIPSRITYGGQTYKVTAIGSHAFKYCDKLVSVTLPSTMESIDEDAFRYCYSLEYVYIPDNVCYIGSNAFRDCMSLSDVEIPEGVIGINERTFMGCTSLSSVVLPYGLEYIDNSSFSGCTSLQSVVIPEGVTYLGLNAFAWCAGLRSALLAGGVEEIGSVFSGCQALEQVVIPEGVKAIRHGAFADCIGLTSVTIPQSVTRIDNKAFSGIPDSAHIYCYATEPCRILPESFNYHCVLHVPRGCREKYQNAYSWRYFATIVEDIAKNLVLDEVPVFGTGVMPAVADDYAASPCRYYDLVGRPVDVTRRGLLIHDGRKVLVR